MKTFIFLAALLLGINAHAASCHAMSGSHRVALLELYTSEGCDSCPPADRWVSALPVHGLDPTRVVTLAYHVDYWNYLGWKDPFAHSRFTLRQRFVNARIGNRTIYTPQLMLDGNDYRRSSHAALQRHVTAGNREAPGADVALSAEVTADKIATAVHVTLRRKTTRAAVFLALHESGLASQVNAGENRGRRLEHDFVVRELAGPFGVAESGKLDHIFHLAPGWNPRKLALAAFVQEAASGKTLQALALTNCKP
jgi:hypothetical protein